MARQANFIKSKKGGWILADEGHLYHRTGGSGPSTYWVCARKPECTARAVTTGLPPDGARIKKAGKHQHAPDQDAVAARKVVNAMKDEAAAHPEEPPARIIRNALADLGDEVLSQVPERPALKRTINRKRQKDLPRNPQSLQDITELPDEFKRTLTGEEFLLHDSRESDSDEDDEVDERDRVMVFGTRNNLRLLGKSARWFVDGTFKVAPLLFLQLLTIHGIFKDHAVPFIYALLTGKQEDLYFEVLDVIKRKCGEFRIHLTDPATLLCDFELPIITACQRAFRNSVMRLCHFHLGQSVYRHVQELGLQVAYNDPEDREVKIAVHQLLSLAFVPPQDVVAAFDNLRPELPQEVLPLADYFETTYIRRRPARRARRAQPGPPRYPVELWNMHEAAVLYGPRTNNLTEGWHNRFNRMVGKRHPSFYHFLREVQGEQRDTEVMISELRLGRRVKVPQLQKYKRVSDRLHVLALD